MTRTFLEFGKSNRVCVSRENLVLFRPTPMTAEASRIVDNSTITEPNPTPPTPNEPQSSEDDVVRSVPDGLVSYYRIRVELKQNGGAKKFHPVQSMREIVHAITGVGKTAVVKLNNNAENNEPLLQIPKGMKETGVFKEYFTVQLQENHAFRKINVIFRVVSELEFPDLKRKLGEYLNAKNIVMHEHVFNGTKVHHCGYLTGLDPSKTDMKSINEYVSYCTDIDNVQVVTGQIFYKGEDKKWTKTDLLSVLTEPKEASTLSKRLIEDKVLYNKGIEYIDCRAIVYHHDFKKDIPEVVGEHKEKLREQTTIIVEDALDDNELFSDIMELETVTFTNTSRANKNSFVVVTTKQRREQTENDLLEIIKKPAYSRQNEVGRPFLRYNDPDVPNRKPTQEKQKTIEIQQEFDEIELEYMKRIKEKAQARRSKRQGASHQNAVELTEEKKVDEKTSNDTKDDDSSQEDRAALEKKLAKKIRKKRHQRRGKIPTKNAAKTEGKKESDEPDDNMECETYEDETEPTAEANPPTPQINRHVKVSWEDEDTDDGTALLSPFKTPMKNLLGRIEEEKDKEESKNGTSNDDSGVSTTSSTTATMEKHEEVDSDAETVQTSNTNGNKKRGASESPPKDDYADWTPAKRFVRKNKQVRILSPYQFLTKPRDLPNKHLGRGGGGRISSSTTSDSRTTRDAGRFSRGGGI